MELLFEKKRQRQVVIFIGLQASGKSSFYHRYLTDYVHINLDTLRSRSCERSLMEKCFSEGRSFVVDNTNPERTDRQRYIPAAVEQGYEVIGIYFQSILKDCIKRNEKRENRVPEVALPSTSKKMALPSYDEGYDKIFYVSMTENDFQMAEWRD